MPSSNFGSTIWTWLVYFVLTFFLLSSREPSSARKLDTKATFDLQVSSNFAPSHFPGLLFIVFFFRWSKSRVFFNSLLTNKSLRLEPNQPFKQSSEVFYHLT